MNKKKIKIHDLEKELYWLQNYTCHLEDGIKDMQAIINESTGAVGYHLNGDIATWDKLLDGSTFKFAEEDMRDKKACDQFRDKDVITKGEKELYIKTYKNMPCCIQYTPVYGGVKYVRDGDFVEYL